MSNNIGRCEVQDRITNWPYISRCKRDAEFPRVFVEPLYEDLNLCKIHLLQYMETLNLSEARDLATKCGLKEN